MQAQSPGWEFPRCRPCRINTIPGPGPRSDVIGIAHVAISYVAHDHCFGDFDNRKTDHLPVDVNSGEASRNPQPIMWAVLRFAAWTVKWVDGRPPQRSVSSTKDPHVIPLGFQGQKQRVCESQRMSEAGLRTREVQ